MTDKEALLHFHIITDDTPRLSVEEIEASTTTKPRKYFKEHATYSEIQEYILDKYGFKAHTQHIALIKRECDVGMINERRKDTGKEVYYPSSEKMAAIKASLIHFKIVEQI